MVNKNILIFWYASLGSVALHSCFVSWMRYVMSYFQPTLVIPLSLPNFLGVNALLVPTFWLFSILVLTFYFFHF